MKYKVDELEGELLDKAVARALLPIAMRLSPREWWDPEYVPPPLLPYSTDWAAGGPVIDRQAQREGLCLGGNLGDQRTCCWADYGDDHPNYHCEGPTLLVAAMRAFVVSEFGDEVDL